MFSDYTLLSITTMLLLHQLTVAVLFLCCFRAENIAEAALCKSVLKPIREQIYQCLEKLHNNDSLKQLTQNQVEPTNCAVVQ